MYTEFESQFCIQVEDTYMYSICTYDLKNEAQCQSQC